MKKTLAYIILVFFLFNSMGYYLLFELDKYMVKKDMEAVIQKNQRPLIMLKIDDAARDKDFRRVEKREIEYKGKLYDIVREVKTGHTTVFFCLHDSKEESLIAGLKMAHHHKLLIAIWDHLIKIAFPEPAMIIGNASSTALIFPLITISLKSSVLQTWSPPPEV